MRFGDGWHSFEVGDGLSDFNGFEKGAGRELVVACGLFKKGLGVLGKFAELSGFVRGEARIVFVGVVVTTGLGREGGANRGLSGAVFG